MALSREAARRGIRSFVECSTGHVYKSSSSPRKESDRLEPWHNLAKWKLKADLEFSKVPGLNYVVLRLPLVYGTFASAYFATAICVARVYQYFEKDLIMMYTKDLKTNTLHVKDCASAIWAAAEWRANKGAVKADDQSTPLHFNVVDHNDTRQEHIAKSLSTIFDLKADFLGSVVSQIAKLNLDNVIDDMNEEVLQGWAELLENSHIERPGPIDPYIERDLIRDQDMSLDGSLFETTTGWKPSRERLDVESFREMIDCYKRMGWWP